MSNASDFVIERGILKYYRGTEALVDVPDKVKAIGSNAFWKNAAIRSVQLPESVTKIGEQAFKNCMALEQVNIPENVKSIGAEAFWNCGNLCRVDFAGNPEKIGLLAFYGCWKLAQDTSIQPLRDFMTRMRLGELLQEEARALYQFSKAKGVASVKEFQNVSFREGDNGRYIYYFPGNENFLLIPTKIGEFPVVNAPSKRIPEDAIAYCSAEQFDKMPRSNRAILAVQWLKEDKMLREELNDVIRTFIKKYAEDVAYALASCEEPAVYRRYLETAKPKSAIIEKLVDQCGGKAEILAVLLSSGSQTKWEPAALSLDAKPKMSVAELKKLWTYQTLTDAETGEKFIEITNYKGHEKHIDIPDFIGKTKVTTVNVVFPAETESVEFPNEEIDLKYCSFRSCKAMADSEGYIVIHIGSRHILTDYIGDKDIQTLTIPAGVTENLYSTFRGLDIREAILPEGFLKLESSSFQDCKKLKYVQLPESLREIGQLAFNGCDALEQLHLPGNVEQIKYMGIRPTLYVKKGSYTEQYAKDNNIPFVAD